MTANVFAIHELDGEAVHSVGLIQPVSQIKRGFGVCLDRARVKYFTRIARPLHKRKRSYVKAAARPVTSVNARWGAYQCGSGFVICSTKIRHFSRSGSGLLTECMSNGEKSRRRESSRASAMW